MGTDRLQLAAACHNFGLPKCVLTVCVCVRSVCAECVTLALPHSSFTGLVRG